MESDKNASGLRIRALRKALALSSERFGRIFSSRKGGKLGARQISYWETGHSLPQHEQLIELVSFLEDPSGYVAEELGRDSVACVALNFLRWGDYDDPHLDTSQATKASLVDPRLIRQTKPGLETLVFDILELRESDEAWRIRLDRCSRFASASPFDEVAIGRMIDRQGADFKLAESKQILAKDIAKHGSGIASLFLSDHGLGGEPSTLISNVVEAYGDGSLSAIKLGGLGMKDVLSDYSLSELSAFNLGILVSAAGARSLDPKEAEEYLATLEGISSKVHDALHNQRQLESNRRETRRLLSENQRLTRSIVGKSDVSSMAEKIADWVIELVSQKGERHAP